MLESVDKLVQQQQTTILGSTKIKYNYNPLVKEPVMLDEEEDDVPQKKNKSNAPKMKFCKVKFDTNFEDGTIATAIFVNENGKPVLQENVKTVTDAAEHLVWMCTARFVIMMNKLWALKTAKTAGGAREFGITLKCLQLEVLAKPVGGGSVKAAFRKALVFDPIDSNELQRIQDTAEEASAIAEDEHTTKGSKTAVESADEEIDGEDGDVEVIEEEITEESDQEPAPPIKGKPTATTGGKSTKKSSPNRSNR